MDLNLVLSAIEKDQQTLCNLYEWEEAFDELVSECMQEYSGQRKKKRRVNAYKLLAGFWEKEVPYGTDEFFKEHFRVEKEIFAMLVQHLKGLQKQNTNFREAIAIEKRIAVALYVLGSSDNYRSVSQKFGVSRSMVGKILHDFCYEVQNVLAPEYLPREFLFPEKMEECVQGFRDMGFPQCFGVIASNHIQIQPPNEESMDYYNSKGWYSTILFTLVDHRHRFLYVNIGCPGSYVESEIYETSKLRHMVQLTPLFRKNAIKMSGVNVPVLLLANSAFRLSSTIMTPYPKRASASKDQKAFNSAHAKAKQVGEEAFEQLKARFRRIGNGMDNHLDKVPMLIMCCCVLHNFFKCHNSEIPENWFLDLEEMPPQPEPSIGMNQLNLAAENIRRALGRVLNKE